MQKFWNSLPIWAKGVIAIATLVILVIVAISLVKAFRASRDIANQKAESDKAQQQLSTLASSGVYPTFTSADAEAKCNSLLEAAASCDAWEQGATVITGIIYGLQNAADWYLLNSTFGVRTWDDCGWWTGDVTGSLTTLLTNELGSGQMAEMRRHLGQFGVSI